MARIGNKTERQNQILKDLEQKGDMTLQEIVSTYGCSEATARRDLEELELSGLIVRTIGGGAKYLRPEQVREVPFREKQQALYHEKMAIARTAASLVHEGDVIGLTGGTTTYLIARELKHHRNITVVTNAVNIAMELSDNEGIQVVLTGGVLRNKSYELCGPLAEQTVKAVNIHTMFMGIDGFTGDGVSTYSELEANIARMLMQRADRTVAVFDHTKIGRSSLFNVAGLSELHGCITDGPMPASLAKALADSHAALHLAELG
ncbi:DeoR/GlpR family DNA-binding transcription regulator [Paenibacillus sp. J22TS3]|uniref:DeoR/GlpR family DNA-binding transcription regulator n=1 Tax=Paenibacillus sp. J22TS3 TaxID=2807192 RepID=UPI001B2EA890|nr:DeoR/GlpR family DNA-binding transcription regulator [Paenibacillus sp. J22TS3]GIP23453.1 GntR family transcriptional regulator [Paenibacillus sp. J22TS3]